MILAIAHIAVSILIIISILLQERSAGLSGILGGEGGAFYQTRRGLEKIVFWGTIILSVLFVLLSILQLIA